MANYLGVALLALSATVAMSLNDSMHQANKFVYKPIPCAEC